MEELRKKAENLHNQTTRNVGNLSEIDLQKLVEELQIHQIELELQNDELRSKHLELESTTRKKYNLFEFAPVGYLILNEKAIIEELNLYAANLLGFAKEYIINLPFISMIERQYMSGFMNYFQQIKDQKLSEPFEIEFRKTEATKFVQITISQYINGTFLAVATDITELKKNQQKLQKSEDHFHSIFNNSQNAIFLLDNTGRYININKTYTEMTGFQPEDLKDKMVGLNTHPDDKARIQNALQQILKQEIVSYKDEIRIIKKDGNPFWIAVKATSHLSPNGSFDYLLGTFEDIDDKKRIEIALQQKSYLLAERLKEMRCLYNIIHFYQNPELTLTEILQGCVNIIPSGWQFPQITCAKITFNNTEYKTENYSETSWKISNNLMQYDQIIGSIQVCYLEEKPLEYEGVFFKEEVDLLNVIAENTGKVIERKQNEIILHEKEAQYRTLADSGMALIWASGIDKLCNYFNAPWLKFTGRTLEQEIGNGWAEGVHPDDFERCLAIYVGAFDQRQTFSMEYRLRHASGEYRWIMDNGTPNYNIHGEFVGYIGHCFDISKIKATEQELRKLKVAVDQSPVTITITNALGSIEYTNPAFSQSTGYTQHEAVGENPRILKSQQTQDSVYSDLWSTISNGKTWQGELINKKKNGEYYFEEAIISPVLDEFNKITNYIALKTDITQRKRAEKALKESEEKFKSLIFDMQVGVLLQGPNAEMLLSNPKALEFLGLTEDQLLGKTSFDPYWNVIHEDGSEFPGHTHPVPLAIATGQAVKGVVMGVFRPEIGDRVWLLVDAEPQLDENRIVKHVVCTFIDITKLKETEKQLIIAKEQAEESDRINKTLLRTIPFGMDIVNENGDILFLSDHLIEKFGEDAMKKKCWELYRDDTVQCSDCPLHAGIKIGTTNIYEAYKVMNGKTFEVIHTGMFFRGQKAILEIFMDITDRKESELIIQQQNLELKKLNANKDKFFSIIAHDLKNPFSSLLGFSNLLIQNFNKYSDEKKLKFIQNIHDSSRKTFTLLENLLEWSQLQRNTIAFNPQIIKLNILAKEAVFSCENIAQNKKISVINIIPEGQTILADRNMLLTVVRNLVSNAIKFTKENGRISISAEADENQVLMCVSDTGIGISPIIIDKLFNVDSKQSGIGTAGETGTGLGLVLCKEFIEKHGGTIWVESEVGKGSDFKFSIPNSL